MATSQVNLEDLGAIPVSGGGTAVDLRDLGAVPVAGTVDLRDLGAVPVTAKARALPPIPALQPVASHQQQQQPQTLPIPGIQAPIPPGLQPTQPEAQLGGSGFENYQPAPITAAGVGSMVPQSVVPALQMAQRYAVDPFNKMAAKGAEIGSIGGRGIVEGLVPGDHPIASGIASGAGEVLGSTITDPRNWPFLASGAARPLLQRFISGGFGIQMGAGAVDAATNLSDNWDNLSPEQRAAEITKLGLTTAMAGGALAHASGLPEFLRRGRAEAVPAEIPQAHALEAVLKPLEAESSVGAMAAGASEVPGTPLAQLTETLPRVESPKLTVGQQISRGATEAWGAAQQLPATLRSGLDKLRTGTDIAMKQLEGKPQWTDMHAAVGLRDGELQRSSLDLLDFKKQLDANIPDVTRRQGITNWIAAQGDEGLLSQRLAQARPDMKVGYSAALELTPSEKTLANNVRNHFDAMLQKAREAGVLEQGVENYLPAVYGKDNKILEEARAQFSAPGLQPNPFFQQHKVFEDLLAGEDAGLTPKKDIGELLAIYNESFGRAVADRAFVKKMMAGKAKDGRPLVGLSGGKDKVLADEFGEGVKAHLIKPNATDEKLAGYIQFDSPALRRWKFAGPTETGTPIFYQADAVVHPDAVKHVNAILGKSAIAESRVGAAAMKASSEFKATLLSGSAFHQVQLGLHGIEHMVNPFTLPKLDRSNARLGDLVDHGLILSDFHARQQFSEGLQASGLLNKLPVIGKISQKYQRYLFQDFLPRLKFKMASDALERNIKRYPDLSRDEVLALTSSQANAAFGGLSYSMLARSKTHQDLLRLAVLAPDFTEARGRFVGQALTKYGGEQRAALLKGAIGGYIGARVLNQILNNDPDWDPAHAFQVKIGNRAWYLRSIQGDLVHMLSNPRNFAEMRANPAIAKPFIEAFTGRDRYGRQRSTGQQVGDYVRGAAPIPLQGVFKESPTDWKQSVGQAVGVGNLPARTRAEETARDLMIKKGTFGEGTRTDAEKKLMAKHRFSMESGKFDVQAVARDVEAGKLTGADARQLQSEERTPRLVRTFKHLSLEDGLKVWDVANDAEREQLRGLLARKGSQLERRLPAERDALGQKLQDALSEGPQGNSPLPRFLRRR